MFCPEGALPISGYSPVPAYFSFDQFVEQLIAQDLITLASACFRRAHKLNALCACAMLCFWESRLLKLLDDQLMIEIDEPLRVSEYVPDVFDDVQVQSCALFIEAECMRGDNFCRERFQWAVPPS